MPAHRLTFSTAPLRFHGTNPKPPGKTAAVKLLEGDKVIAETASPDHALGAVVIVASSSLADATIAIK